VRGLVVDAVAYAQTPTSRPARRVTRTNGLARVAWKASANQRKTYTDSHQVVGIDSARAKKLLRDFQTPRENRDFHHPNSWVFVQWQLLHAVMSYYAAMGRHSAGLWIGGAAVEPSSASSSSPKFSRHCSAVGTPTAANGCRPAFKPPRKPRSTRPAKRNGENERRHRYLLLCPKSVSALWLWPMTERPHHRARG